MRTDDACETLVAGYGFPVVAFPPLELLCEVDGGLQGFSLEVEFVYAALGDH